MIKTFKDLDVWRNGIALVKEVYTLTSKFPSTEAYGLTAQMRRSAISIPSNVAEGFKRRHTKEFKQFLNITLGSLAELETQIIIAKELNYIDCSTNDYILEKIDHLSRMAFNLHRKLV